MKRGIGLNEKRAGLSKILKYEEERKRFGVNKRSLNKCR